MFHKVLRASQIRASADEFESVFCLFVDAPQRMRSVSGNALDDVLHLNSCSIHFHCRSFLSLVQRDCETVPNALQNVIRFGLRQSRADVAATRRIGIGVEDHIRMPVGEFHAVSSDLLSKLKSVVDAIDHRSKGYAGQHDDFIKERMDKRSNMHKKMYGNKSINTALAKGLIKDYAGPKQSKDTDDWIEKYLDDHGGYTEKPEYNKERKKRR